jgi:hypothetical protein
VVQGHLSRKIPCRIGENAVIPAKAGIQVLEIVVVTNRLDARLRGHDEL